MTEVSQMFFRLYDRVMCQYKNDERLSSRSIPELTVNDEYYLDIIYRLGGPTYTEFAEAAVITKPAATQIVKRFIEKGYVRRIRSTEDRRVYHLRPDDSVKQYFDENYRFLDEVFDKCLSVLDQDEIAQLKAIFSKIDRNL